MISVLFAAKNSVYKTLSDSSGEPLDCWDEERDAMKWPGGNPLVAHPPCRLFCKLKHMSTAPQLEKQLAYWAVGQVQRWGGVLEHPAGSTLWRELELPRPGKRDELGFTVGLEQYWFGHPSTKKTWLYVSGTTPSEIPAFEIRMGFPVYVFAGGKGNYVPGSRHSGIRSATPPAFARWLIETAERCNTKVTK